MLPFWDCGGEGNFRGRLHDLLKNPRTDRFFRKIPKNRHRLAWREVRHAIRTHARISLKNG